MRERLLGTATTAWRGLAGGLQWRLLWLTQGTFMVGSSVIVLAPDGRILVLRHRFYPSGREWGLPGGYLKRSESLARGIDRELHEEVGLTGTRDHRLIGTRAGFRLRIELLLTCRVDHADVTPDGVEVLEARWTEPDRASDSMDPWQLEAWSRFRHDPALGVPLQ